MAFGLNRITGRKKKNNPNLSTDNHALKYSGYDPILGTPFYNISSSMGSGISFIPEYILAEAMAVNIAVYRSVNVIAGEIGAMPWNLIDIKTGEIIDNSQENDHIHPLAGAIDNQWKDSGQPFFFLWAASLLFSGKTFIQPLKSILGTNHVGVNWLNPINMQVEAPQGVIIGYTYNTQQGTIPFTKYDIVYDRLFNPNDDNAGLSPTHLVIRNAKIDYRSKEALLAFYVNGALPYAIISAKDMAVNAPMHKEAWEKLRTQLTEQHKGSANQYKVLVHGLPVDVNTFETPDLEKHTRYLESLRNEVYVAFGVPPAVAGDTTGTPYKDAAETYEAFFTQGIEPYTRRIEQAINNALILYFDKSGKIRFEFDTAKYDALRKNETEELANAQSMYTSGAITLQSYQQMIETQVPINNELQSAWKQLPPMVYVPALNMPVPLAELPNLWKTTLPSMQSSGLLPDNNNMIVEGIADKIEETKGQDKDDDELFPMLGGYRVKERPIEEIIEESNDKAKQELKAWLRFKRNNAKNKTSNEFVFHDTRPSVERYIKDELEKGSRYFDIYTNACKIHSMKALENVKSRYTSIVSGFIQSARNNEINEKRFRDLYRAEHKRFIAEAFSSGLEDAGIFDPPTEKEMEEIKALQVKDTPFIREFAKVLFSDDGITDAQAAQKPQQWWASITPAYSAGLAAGGDNGMYEWSGSDGENSCITCQWLDGPPPHRHRKNIWQRNNLDLTGGAFVGQGTKCKGFQCLHELIRRAGKSQGGTLTKAPR